MIQYHELLCQVLEHGKFKREYGDYEGLAVAAGVAHPVWTDTRRLRTLREEVYTTTLTDASFPH